MFWRKRTGGPRADPLTEVRAGLMPVVFSAVWLAFLTEPLMAAWDQRDGWRGTLGLAGIVVFCVLYVWHFARCRRHVWAGPWGRATRLPLAERLPLFLALLALAVALPVLLGQTGTNTWVFVAVSALFTFRLPVAYAIGIALAAAYEWCSYNLAGWQRESGVVLSIVLAMLAVTMGILASRRQQDLAAARRENARLAVEEERGRVARDLHDILGHSLTVITVKAELAGRLIDLDPARAKAEVESLEALSREALADVRKAVQGFREISLAGELVTARNALHAAGIEPDVPSATDEVPGDLRELFAWVVREGVTNVVRHSQARHCRIDLTPARVTVTDDGTAPEPAAIERGLRGLRERARAAGAVVTTRWPDEGGFELSVDVGRA